MKKIILIIGICVLGLLGVAKIGGLIFLEFSVKQAVYAVALLVTAYAMFTSLRAGKPPSDDE